MKNERCFFSEKKAQKSKEYRGLSSFDAGICHRLKRKKCRVMPPIEKEEKPEKRSMEINKMPGSAYAEKRENAG